MVFRDDGADATFTTLAPSLPPGSTVPSSGYLAEDTTAHIVDIVSLEAIRNIELATMARFYVDEEGNAKLESRYARNP
jgi:hypothetical protein